MAEKNKLKSSIKYPTSIIVRGDDFLAVEIAKSIIEQGGYVIVIDHDVEKTRERYKDIEKQNLLSIIDFSSITYLEDDLRRLDYVFFLNHDFDIAENIVSSQEFLQVSNYLDLMIGLSTKFEAKLLLTSSIRAHQILINGTDLDLSLERKNDKSHAIYSQLEIQRYAEALCMESVEKVNLNARITRLGKVIGPGMEFDTGYSFDRLIVQAVKGKNLELYADGLESNMYVHVLDAAYGAIKAMFTKGTRGKVYSVANEEEITDLSIAYKLQEMTGLNREIKFMDNDDPLPPIKYYKPATSLMRIGWTPRIAFTRALSQVLEYAAKVDANESTEISEGDSEEEEVYDPTSVGQEGALARLIAERKAQEKARTGSILVASQQFRDKKKNQRRLTRYDKLQRFLQRRYDSLAYDLEFLKKITIVEAFFYLILLVLFGFIYIGYIAPAFVIGREIVELNYYEDNLDEKLESGKYNEIGYEVDQINDSVTTINSNYKKFEVIYDLLGKKDEYTANYGNLNTYKLYTNTLAESMNLFSDFDEYWKNSDFGLLLKPNSDSKITVTDSTVDSDQVNLLKSNAIEFDQQLEKLELTEDVMNESLGVNMFGYQLGSLLARTKEYQPMVQSNLSYIDKYTQLFFTSNPKTYMLVLQDNSRYTPGGGFPASVGYITTSNGRILDINLYPVTSRNDVKIDTLTDSEVKEIQTNTGEFVEQGDITLADLFLVRDRERVGDDLLKSLEETYAVDADTILYFDLETLGKLIGVSNTIEINNVLIGEQNLLDSIDILQGEDASVDERNEVLTNIFAQLITTYFESDSFIYKSIDVLYKSMEQSKFEITTTDYDLHEELGFRGAVVKDDWIQIGLKIDPKATRLNIFPSARLRVEDVINEDFIVTRSITLEPGSSENLERVVVCMDSNAKEFEFGESNLALGQTFSSGEICVAGDSTQSENLTFSYKFEPSVDNLSGDQYNMELSLLVAPGSEVTYDWDVELSSELRIVEEGQFSVAGGVLTTSGKLEDDLDIDFIISK